MQLKTLTSSTKCCCLAPSAFSTLQFEKGTFGAPLTQSEKEKYIQGLYGNRASAHPMLLESSLLLDMPTNEEPRGQQSPRPQQASAQAQVPKPSDAAPLPAQAQVPKPSNAAPLPSMHRLEGPAGQGVASENLCSVLAQISISWIQQPLIEIACSRYKSYCSSTGKRGRPEKKYPSQRSARSRDQDKTYGKWQLRLQTK